jgi:prevent-host-death family protein
VPDRSRRRVSDMPASEFKAKCLRVMETVRATGEAVLITKHGKPLVRVVPAMQQAPSLFGRLAGTVVHEGDVVSPIDVEWDAERD